MTETPFLTPANPAFSGFKGDLLQLTADAPLPPGTRVELDIFLPRGDRTVHVAGKVVKAAPPQKGRFGLSVRLHSIPREDRLALVTEAASGSTDS